MYDLKMSLYTKKGGNDNFFFVYSEFLVFIKMNK